MKNTKIILCSALLAMTMSAGTAFASATTVAELAAESAITAVSEVGGVAASIVSASHQDGLKDAMESDSRLLSGIKKAVTNLKELDKVSGAMVDSASVEKLKEANAQFLRACAEARSKEDRDSLAKIGQGELIQRAANAEAGDTQINSDVQVQKVIDTLKGIGTISLNQMGQACQGRGA